MFCRYTVQYWTKLLLWLPPPAICELLLIKRLKQLRIYKLELFYTDITMHMHDIRIFKSRLITIVVALVIISQYHSQSF